MKAISKGLLVQQGRIYEVPVTIQARESDGLLEISIDEDPLLIIPMVNPIVKKVLRDIAGERR